MWKIGTKGRYGFLVSVVTTMFDFVLLNVGYLYAIHNIGDVGQFSEKVVWIFVNISYAPAILLFPDIHNKRILYADRLMIILFQVFIIHFLSFLSLVTISGCDNIPPAVYVKFFAVCYAALALWWITSRKIVKFFRRKGLNYRQIIIVGWNGTSQRLYQEIQSDLGYGYRIVGIFDNAKHKDVKITGKLADIASFISNHSVDVCIVLFHRKRKMSVI